jgi:hypothetical protein
MNHPCDDYDRRFEESQRRRQSEFATEQERRNMCFTRAEGKRDKCEGTRTKESKRHEQDRERNFQMATSSRHRRFFQKEFVRNQGRSWRHQQFKDSEDCRSQSFERSLLWDRKQYAVMDEIELAKLELIRRRVEQLDEMQRRLFEQAKTRRWATFLQSQARHHEQLGLITFPMPGVFTPPGFIPSPYTSSLSCSLLSSARSSPSASICGISPQRLRLYSSRSRSRSPRRRRSPSCRRSRSRSSAFVKVAAPGFVSLPRTGRTDVTALNLAHRSHELFSCRRI